MQLKILRKKLKDAVGTDSIRLMTLTTRNVGQAQDVALSIIAKDWDTLLKRMKRRFGKIKYFRIVQFHKNGLPHLHIIIDKYIPHSWLSAAWSDIHNSPIVDIRHKDNHHAVNYITRYISKELLSDSPLNALFSLTHTRRYSKSRSMVFTSKGIEFQLVISKFYSGSRDILLIEFIDELLKSYDENEVFVSFEDDDVIIAVDNT